MPRDGRIARLMIHYGDDRPAGQHRVDLRFTGARPDPLGIVLTLAGLLALALLRRGDRGR